MQLSTKRRRLTALEQEVTHQLERWAQREVAGVRLTGSSGPTLLGLLTRSTLHQAEALCAAMTDDELEAVLAVDPVRAAWLETLTDAELATIIRGGCA
jgi:hypothetical protein